MKALRCLVALLVLVTLAGCANSPLFRPDEAQDVTALLANYRRAAMAGVEEQQRELAAAQVAHEKAPTDVTRLGLALAMLLPQISSHDDARLQSLLNGVSAPSGERASPRYDLAQSLLALIAERQRAQREDQRKQDQLARQLREEKRRSEEMQQKIESLRAIDRDLRGKRRIP
jgi:predicted small lipoprotein YifL